jgi:hypothetical protein
MGFADLVEWQGELVALRISQEHLVASEPDQRAREVLAPALGAFGGDARLAASVVFEVDGFHQRSLDTWRADFESILSLDQAVIFVEQTRERAADAGAVLEGDTASARRQRMRAGHFDEHAQHTTVRIQHEARVDELDPVRGANGSGEIMQLSGVDELFRHRSDARTGLPVRAAMRSPWRQFRVRAMAGSRVVPAKAIGDKNKKGGTPVGPPTGITLNCRASL